MNGIGTSNTRLIVLRGNSGAGKSRIARTLRSRLSGCVAWVEQDYFRRVVLREHDVPMAATSDSFRTQFGTHSTMDAT